MPQRASTLSLLRNGNFRTLWSATLVSNLGGLIQAVGAGWMMTLISSSSDMVALVQAANTLPIMIFSLAAGALADNIDRRIIMLTAQSLLMLVSVLLAVVAFFGMLTPWMLLGFTFLIGCGTALHNPSWQASMGDIVPREDLAIAVSLNSMGFNLMRSIGPAIGGIIVAFAGAPFAFALNAASYVSLIAALAWWKPKREPRTLPREHLGGAIGAGLRYMIMSPNLLKVMLRSFTFGFAGVAIMALLPVLARDHVNGGAFSYGILLGCFGGGAILGAFANGWIREVLSNETIVRGSFLGFAASAALLALSHNMILSCLVLIPAGACWVLALSLFNVTVQLSTPRWVVGRALALYQTAVFGGMAFGSWLWGSLADSHGSAEALYIAAAGMVIGAALGLLFKLPEFSKLNLDPLDEFSEPVLRLDLRARSGPIVIMIDYQIRQDDVESFLEAMFLRRRIRIRDGARQWSLLRDLEDPEIWTETYHVPTWVEYVRHNQRRTQADAEVTRRLRELHNGDEPPRVHRTIERQTVPRHDDMPLKHNITDIA